MYPTWLALVFPLFSIATMAVAQSMANASNILTYPICAQYCSNNTFPGCHPLSTDCVCGASYRSQTVACEGLICNQADFNTATSLAQQLCSPLYAANSTLSSSVSAAIASATAVAIADVAGKDVTDVSIYPQCSQNCFSQVGYFGCGSLANRTCVCTNPDFNQAAGTCEIENCTSSEITLALDLVGVLCEQVFGISNATTATAVFPTNTSIASPTVIPFKGAATSLVSTGFNVLFVALMGLMGSAILL